MERRKQRSRNHVLARSRNSSIPSSSERLSTILHLQGRKWISRGSIFCIGILCLIILSGITFQAISNHNLSEQLQATRTETQNLQQKNKQLQQNIVQYAQPSMIEVEARRELQYIHAGDHVIIMSPPSIATKQSTSIASTSNSSTWWQSLWSFLMHPIHK